MGGEEGLRNEDKNHSSAIGRSLPTMSQESLQLIGEWPPVSRLLASLE